MPMSDYRDQEFYTPGDEYRKPEGEFGATKQTVGYAPEFRTEPTATTKKVRPTKSLTAQIRKLCAFMGATVAVGGYVVSGAMFSGAFSEGSGPSGGGSTEPSINYSSFLSISKVYDWDTLDTNLNYHWTMFLRDNYTNEPITAGGTDSTFFEYSLENIINPYIAPHNAELDNYFTTTSIVPSVMVAGEYTYEISYDSESVDRWFPRTLTVKTEEYTYEYAIAKVIGSPVIYCYDVATKSEVDIYENNVTSHGMPFVCEETDEEDIYKLRYPMGFDFNFYMYEGAKPKIIDNSTGEVINPGTEAPTEVEPPTDENVASDSLLIFWYQYHYYENNYKNYPEWHTTLYPDVSQVDGYYDSRVDDDLKGIDSVLAKTVIDEHISEVEAFFEDNKDSVVSKHKQGDNGPIVDVTDWFKPYLNVKYTGISQRYKVKAVNMSFTFSYTSDDNVYTSSSYEKDGWRWFTDGLKFTILMDEDTESSNTLSSDMLYFAWTYEARRLDYSSYVTYVMSADTADHNQGEHFFINSNSVEHEQMADSMNSILDTYVKPYADSELSMFFDFSKEEHLDFAAHWDKEGYTNPTKDVTSWFPDELTYYAGEQKMHVTIDHVTAYIVDGRIPRETYEAGEFTVYTSPCVYYAEEDEYIYAYGIEFQVVGTFEQL